MKLPPRFTRVRTTEPVADTKGIIHPAGTEGNVIGPGNYPDTIHVRTETGGPILPSLVSAQFEVTE